MPTIEYDTTNPPPDGSVGAKLILDALDVMREPPGWRSEFRVADLLIMNLCLAYVSSSGHVVVHPRDLQRSSRLCRATVYASLAKLQAAGVLSLVEDGPHGKPSVYAIDVRKSFANSTATAA